MFNLPTETAIPVNLPTDSGGLTVSGRGGGKSHYGYYSWNNITYI